MTVVRYEPWSLLNRLRRELDQTFEFAAHEASWTPAVDIHEEDKQSIELLGSPFLVACSQPLVNVGELLDLSLLALLLPVLPINPPAAGRQKQEHGNAQPAAVLLAEITHTVAPEVLIDLSQECIGDIRGLRQRRPQSGRSGFHIAGRFLPQG